MQLTLISHFYNEEFLLPFWLDHHRRIFDHGILIDYDSTDRSVDIIKEMAPEWTVIPSRNSVFDYIALDQEVMDVESTIGGWKIVLNTTEFIVHPDLRGYAAQLEKSQTVGVRCTGMIMVDLIETSQDRVVPKIPLLYQRHHGCFDSDRVLNWKPSRSRLLHRERHGHYNPGRHATKLNVSIDETLLLCWYGFSPYEQIVERKLQIQNRIPKEHFDQGFGIHHKIDRKQLDATYKQISASASDLWIRNPRLKDYTKTMYPELFL